MQLSRLIVSNYRNLESVDLEFSPKINCFLGDNGMGKTNVLDAIYYLSFCKSSTMQPDAVHIRHGEEFFSIKGDYRYIDGDMHTVLCSYRAGGRKHIKKNDKEIKRISEHVGTVPLVMISPNDIELISGGSEERRKYMDVALSQCNPEYLAALIRYGKTLQQRNALLKNEQVDYSVLDVLDEMMAVDGDYIYDCRKTFIKDVQPFFQAVYAHIGEEHEKVEMHYVSHGERGGLLGQLKASREKDVIVGHTLHGVHRDDVELLFAGYPLRREGSQGQRKSYQLAMKLAQFFYLRDEGKTNAPLLLLDDIFDKLDASRVERIVRYVASDAFGQIFITDTNREHLDRLLSSAHLDHKLFFVKEGRVE